MDRLTYGAGGAGAAPESRSTRTTTAGGGSRPADESAARNPGAPTDDMDSEDIDSEDIESELFCSTREAGITAVGFGPGADL